MRSRYTAFVVADVPYLLDTWHASTRPSALALDDGLRWRGLVVLDRVGGGPFDRDGVVEFEAFWEQGAQRGAMRERSRFVREERRWRYLDGQVQ